MECYAMEIKNNVALSEAELLRCLALLGPPPILSSEDRKDFEEIFRLVAQCVGPRNMVEVIYLWHFVCASWLVKRYGRHAAVSIERQAQETLKFHAERAKLRQQRKLDRENKEVEKLVQTPADVAYLVRLENNFDAMVAETMLPPWKAPRSETIKRPCNTVSSCKSSITR